MVSLDQLDDLKKSQELLQLLLSNKYLPNDISLVVMYNRSATNKEKYDWMTSDLFDKQMKLEELQKKFRIKLMPSVFIDCGQCDNSYPTGDPNKPMVKLNDFASSIKIATNDD
jgi:hypothetical protein